MLNKLTWKNLSSLKNSKEISMRKLGIQTNISRLTEKQICKELIYYLCK